MQLNEYVEWTENTSAKLPSKDLDILHMLLGMTTEIGELTDIFKKSLAYKKEIDEVNVEEEIGDLMWYIASFCRVFGLDLEQIILTNINKLESRYPEKFTEYYANHRDLQKEREILEGKQ